jgi:hypothetical protein
LRSSEDGNSFGLAVLAAFRFVAELLVVKEQLFPGGEDEVGTAIDAGEYLILKFH